MFCTQTSAFRVRKNVLVAVGVLLSGFLVAIAGCGGSSDSSGGGRLQNKIVFSVSSTIYTVNPDGTDRDELFVESNRLDYYEKLTPSVSPDGSRIVFKRLSLPEADGVPSSAIEFWVMNADGSGLRRIATFDYRVNVNSLRFSPDSSKILFTRWVQREIEEYPHVVTEGAICVMNANSGEPTVIAQAEYYNDASFSPDGSKILYSRKFRNDSPGGYIFNVYTINADGTGETLLATDAFAPSYSPDGSRIVYIQQQPNGASEISVMNADGSAQTRLTNDGNGDANPSFSPDGTKILFASYRGLGGHLVADWGNGLLHTMNTDGSEPTQLLGNEIPPVWYQVTSQAWVGATTR